jgi:hypothetical protein
MSMPLKNVVTVFPDVSAINIVDASSLTAMPVWMQLHIHVYSRQSSTTATDHATWQVVLELVQRPCTESQWMLCGLRSRPAHAAHGAMHRDYILKTVDQGSLSETHIPAAHMNFASKLLSNF